MIRDIFDNICYIFGFGYKVEVENNLVHSHFYGRLIVHPKCEEWLRENIMGRYMVRMKIKKAPLSSNGQKGYFYYRSNRESVFLFSKKSDAMLFKLVWG